MIARIITIILLLIYVNASFSQDSSSMRNYEYEISELLKKSAEATSDSEKINYADIAAQKLQDFLSQDYAFDYNFSQAKSISSVKSADNKVRVVTFATEFSDGTFNYYGYVIYNNTNRYVLTRLFDKKDLQTDPMRANMQAENWYGALYYEIAMFGNKKSPVYALCGWDGADLFTNRKVLEQLSFSNDGKAKFGGSFKAEKGAGFQRLVFCFTEKAIMSLRYDSKQKMIVADHLSAPPQYRNNPRFYGPDMSFDGYYYDKGTWFYEPDVDVKFK